MIERSFTHEQLDASGATFDSTGATNTYHPRLDRNSTSSLTADVALGGYASPQPGVPAAVNPATVRASPRGRPRGSGHRRSAVCRGAGIELATQLMQSVLQPPTIFDDDNDDFLRAAGSERSHAVDRDSHKR
jgi:hypothetical protein